MGRLPDKYKDLKIVDRQPYSLGGEAFVTAGVRQPFPESTFILDTATGQSFEIHRAIVRLTAFDNGTFANNVLQIGPVVQIYEPQPDVSAMVELAITDLSRDEVITKNEALVLGLLTADALTWEWEDPFTFDDQSGFLVTAIPATSFGFSAGSGIVPVVDVVGAIGSIRVEITFEGYLLTLEQPPAQVTPKAGD